MRYEQLKQIALGICKDFDTVYDCGGVLQFSCTAKDDKGLNVSIVKVDGQPIPYVLAIEDGLVNEHPILLNFETGEPAEEGANA